MHNRLAKNHCMQTVGILRLQAGVSRQNATDPSSYSDSRQNGRLRLTSNSGLDSDSVALVFTPWSGLFLAQRCSDYLE